MSVEYIDYREFGVVKIKYDTRACRIIFRVKDGVLEVTVPVSTPVKTITKCIDERRSDILQLFAKSKSNTLRVGDSLQTRCFTLHFYSHSLSKMLFSLKNGEFNIFIPQEVDVESNTFQKLLKQNIIKVTKRVAAPYLQSRLKKLAAMNGLTYNDFSVSIARQRLGVCSSKRKITLSAYLIFYPEHLIDYVILHELTHLTEMNHGPRFHSLCNKYCGGRERELEREFKNFKLPL
ncbi:MAG: DUF45 domain-containing protein [Bacteroidales bacterium]|nr:DUF45 domain-containing protein [Bacteroidales bacterium]